MPRGEKITEDFLYFQKELTSFRPMEFAVLAQNDYKVSDYEVLREIAKVEQHLKSYDELRGVMSNTVIYKTINQMYNSNRLDAYRFPPDETTFNRYQRLANQLPQMTNFVLESKDGKKARITSRVNDIGADSVKYLGISIDQWIKDNTNPNVVKFVRTGTALIIDKNAEYVRRNLLMGLGGAIVVIGILMGGLFWSWRMLVISMIPNIFPLFIAGALLGFTGIELEAGVSIVFSVIYGIAVDDTIHFLSKFRLVRAKGYNVEDALHVTFLESGKAIGLTTVILFFGFLVMLFSIHPPSVIIGTLISVTLFSAYFSDLFLLPILIRWLIKDK
jgi:predicted RND superfamily exporter protein